MPFKTDLSVKSLRKSDFFQLEKQLIYVDKVHGKIVVPRFFKTDYASVPKLFRNLVDEDGSYIRDAAVVHDYLYSTGKVLRQHADCVLYRAMRELGATHFQAKIVYLSVRLFGGSHFKRKRNEKK